MYGIIYLLTSPSGKHYVGQTQSTFGHRWSQHIFQAKNYAKTCRYLHAAIRKYSSESFQKDIIAECHSKSELDRLEHFWIDMLHCCDRRFGYNLKIGGPRGKASEETRQKISMANSGKHHSEETKNKISQSKKSQHLIAWNKDKSPTQKTREKMRLAHIGKQFTEQAKINMGKARIGRICSKETRLKISNANTGKHSKPLSEEHKLKVSKSITAWWLQRKTKEENAFIV